MKKLLLEITKIKKMMGLSEGEFLFDKEREGEDFLNKVKTTTPDAYSKIYNIYKNKGLEKAMEAYVQYDPEVLKRKEEEADLKSKELAKARGKKVIEKMKSLLPNTTQVKEIVDKYFFTPEIRSDFRFLMLPQPSSKNVKVRVLNQSQRNFRIEYNFMSFRSLNKKTLEDLYDNLLYGISDDDILDDIIKSRKEYKTMRSYEKDELNYLEYIDTAIISLIVTMDVLRYNGIINNIIKHDFRINLSARFSIDIQEQYMTQKNLFKISDFSIIRNQLPEDFFASDSDAQFEPTKKEVIYELKKILTNINSKYSSER